MWVYFGDEGSDYVCQDFRELWKWQPSLCIWKIWDAERQTPPKREGRPGPRIPRGVRFGAVAAWGRRFRWFLNVSDGHLHDIQRRLFQVPSNWFWLLVSKTTFHESNGHPRTQSLLSCGSSDQEILFVFDFLKNKAKCFCSEISFRFWIWRLCW